MTAAAHSDAKKSDETEPSWHGQDPRNPDAERWTDPFPAVKEMRERWPVNETPDGIWRLFRYRDVVRVLRELPSGVRLTDGTPPGNAMGGANGGTFMLQQDPPNHTRLRKLVSKAFTPRATELWRPRAKEIVTKLIDRGLEAGEMDVISGLAQPVPSQLICEMLGVPFDDHEDFTAWTSDGIHVLRGSFLTPEERTKVEAAIGNLATYFEALIAERRAKRGDDLLSVMIAAEEEGDRLTSDELLVQSIGLLAAGFETTIGLIGLGAKNLAEHPGELARLRAEPSMIGTAVEECLRYEGPIGMTTRVLHADAEFDGRRIPQDTTMWLSIWGGNRDPEIFDDPERFDIGRSENPHLAFGGGTHMCLGAHLARMEAQEALGALATRTKVLERTTSGIELGPSLFRVPATLPVRLVAA
jgi:cytochrome P450